MKSYVLCIVLLFCLLLQGQQVPDTLFAPPIPNPAYQQQSGPVILIDEGHHNFHTKDGRYTAFSRLLERDGYKVGSSRGTFGSNTLEGARILVISNALHSTNVQNWYLPTPSAFEAEEIEFLRNWVQQGGRLFLIADHMPLAGAAADLAAAFGFEFTNGYVLDNSGQGPAFFSLEDGNLHPGIITRGRISSESLTQVTTFTGQAFKIPKQAKPVLTFSENFTNFLPDTAGVFTAETPRIPAAGYHQGAFMDYGKGKLYVSGEAAMFSAQLAGPEKWKMGMNNPQAPQNYQFLLNIIHWLDDRL